MCSSDRFAAYSECIKHITSLLLDEYTIEPYGSYIIDPHDCKDLDLACVPKSDKAKEKSYFFDYVSKVLDSPFEFIDAKAPLIRTTLSGISIDIVLSTDFNNVDACKKILKTVRNIDIFRKVLRIVKKWARSRSIYSNLYGYLGGISWSILVARLCKIESLEKSSVSQIVSLFFKYYSKFDFSNAISIDHDQKGKEIDVITEMMIILPGHPINTSYRVCKGAKERIISEFKKEQNLSVPLESYTFSQWRKEHKIYLEIIPKNKKEIGIVGSRLYKFCMDLEKNGVICNIWPEEMNGCFYIAIDGDGALEIESPKLFDIKVLKKDKS